MTHFDNMEQAMTVWPLNNARFTTGRTVYAQMSITFINFALLTHDFGLLHNTVDFQNVFTMLHVCRDY